MKEKRYISFCFLILHYMNIELTFKTVESVLNLYNFNDSQIIIVDNASPNGSGKLLVEKYSKMGQIHIILSPNNIGFSAGNNLGFQHIKQNFITDFIVVINNDILFPQKEFLDKVKELYLEAPFWVAGPDILQPHKNYHSSPAADKWRNAEDMKLLIGQSEKEKRELMKKVSLGGWKLYLKDCFPDNVFIKRIFRLKRFIQGQQKSYAKRSEDVVLQGSCLIFDRRYCEKNDELFLPLTFMYAEEEILTWRCKKNNWKIRYFPEIQVWHINHGSSKFPGLSYKQYCKKKISDIDRLVVAFKIYLKQITVGNEV